MTRPLEVSRLRLLREVAIRGSIAAAAREVGLTPSAVSQQLAILEREAGAALLDRTPRGVLLTGPGRVLVERATAILELLESASADLERLTGELAGEVRVATVASAGAALVSPAADRLARLHPELNLTVTVAEPARSIEALLNGDLDVAVVDVYDGVPVAIPDYLQLLELATEELVLVSRPGDFPLRAKVKLGDLNHRHWVMPPAEAACGQAVRAACRSAGFEPEVRWETDDMLLLVRAVAAGHGVAVLPRLAVADDVADVQTRPLAGDPMSRRLLALTRTSSQDRPVVQAVLTALAERSAGG
ncbi:LysR family transcriptional regulator [Jatrophihabitans telluris]|uniref:LysR family transcriptional regulator n=1 Tax=Jatrophihabitans telluris TaxID=2038343 RepID=A0ABY4QWJ5_9ACTN|nr:LysR family transcriptional regulator [Jatrophihabitans telluris]UQX87689.1 LysR family transcriptional regulator [Jatrophihabitans telluris]